MYVQYSNKQKYVKNTLYYTVCAVRPLRRGATRPLDVVRLKQKKGLAHRIYLIPLLTPRSSKNNWRNLEESDQNTIRRGVFSWMFPSKLDSQKNVSCHRNDPNIIMCLFVFFSSMLIKNKLLFHSDNHLAHPDSVLLISSYYYKVRKEVQVPWSHDTFETEKAKTNKPKKKKKRRNKTTVFLFRKRLYT